MPQQKHFPIPNETAITVRTWMDCKWVRTALSAPLHLNDRTHETLEECSSVKSFSWCVSLSWETPAYSPFCCSVWQHCSSAIVADLLTPSCVWIAPRKRITSDFICSCSALTVLSSVCVCVCAQEHFHLSCSFMVTLFTVELSNVITQILKNKFKFLGLDWHCKAMCHCSTTPASALCFIHSNTSLLISLG